MKKIFKKAIVALMAMAMVIGTLTVTASAADTNSITVTASGGNVGTWGEVNIWCWNGAENFTGGSWPGMAMTESSGTYSITLDIPKTVQSVDIILSGGGSQTGTITVALEKDTINISDVGNANTVTQSGNALATQDADAGKVTKDIEVFVKLEGDFSSVDLTKVCVYRWNDGFAGSLATGWPGTELTLDDEIYSGTFKVETSVTEIGMNVNNGGDEFKTGDLTGDLSTGKLYITVNADKTATVATTEPASWTAGDSDSDTGSGSDSDAGNSGSGSDSDAGNTGSGSDSDTGNSGSGSDSDAGNSGSGSDSDAGNTGSGSDSDAGNTGSGSDSDAGNTGSGSDTDNNNNNAGNGGTGTDTNTGVSNAVVVACAVVMLAAVVAVIASKKRVTE